MKINLKYYSLKDFLRQLLYCFMVAIIFLILMVLTDEKIRNNIIQGGIGEVFIMLLASFIVFGLPFLIYFVSMGIIFNIRKTYVLDTAEDLLYVKNEVFDLSETRVYFDLVGIAHRGALTVWYRDISKTYKVGKIHKSQRKFVMDAFKQYTSHKPIERIAKAPFEVEKPIQRTMRPPFETTIQPPFETVQPIEQYPQQSTYQTKLNYNDENITGEILGYTIRGHILTNHNLFIRIPLLDDVDILEIEKINKPDFVYKTRYENNNFEILAGEMNKMTLDDLEELENYISLLLVLLKDSGVEPGVLLDDFKENQSLKYTKIAGIILLLFAFCFLVFYLAYALQLRKVWISQEETVFISYYSSIPWMFMGIIGVILVIGLFRKFEVYNTYHKKSMPKVLMISSAWVIFAVIFVYLVTFIYQANVFSTQTISYTPSGLREAYKFFEYYDFIDVMGWNLISALAGLFMAPIPLLISGLKDMLKMKSSS